MDANTRQASEEHFALGQSLQGDRSEPQREREDRTDACTKLDQRPGEGHHFTDSAVVSESKAREENDNLWQKSGKQQPMEETCKLNATISPQASQVKTFSVDLEKDLALCAVR